MAIIITLWIGNGAVRKSSNQKKLKEFWKWIIHGRNYLIFKLLLIAIEPLTETFKNCTINYP